MNFTDIFIRKPVLATTISLLILVLGIRSLVGLPVRQYPKTQNAVVTISTAYYGADARTGFCRKSPGFAARPAARDSASRRSPPRRPTPTPPTAR